MMAIVGDTRDTCEERVPVGLQRDRIDLPLTDVGRQREAEHLHHVWKQTDIAIVPNFMDVELRTNNQ